MQDISYFQDEDGVLLPRPHTDELSTLQQSISDNRPMKGLLSTAQYVADGEQWQWFRDYINHCYDTAIVMDKNLNLAVIGQDEHGADIHAEPQELPPPLRLPPTVRTADQVLTATGYYKTKFKAERARKVEAIKVQVGDVLLDGDETSQNRLVRAIVVMQGMKLSAMNQAIVTAAASPAVTVADLLASLVTSINESNITIPWKTADDQTVLLDLATAEQALAASGGQQTAVWGVN